MLKPARDGKHARLLPTSTLDALSADLIIRCASYLDADGLARLGRTSARFGIIPAGQQRSLANEAAHQLFQQSVTDEERGCLPQYTDESDIGLYRALEQLRKPLCFGELAGEGFDPQEYPASVTCTGRVSWSTAVSGHVMRGGRHSVEFSATSARWLMLGVIRPVSLTKDIDLEADWGGYDWGGYVNPMLVRSNNKPVVAEKLRSQRTAKWGDSNVHCCTYFCGLGHCYWSDWSNLWKDSSWQGSESLQESGTIGLLLDLDEGSLSVFKNGRRLGVMKDGLDGEYRWFVAACLSCTISMSKGR